MADYNINDRVILTNGVRGKIVAKDTQRDMYVVEDAQGKEHYPRKAAIKSKI